MEDVDGTTTTTVRRGCGRGRGARSGGGGGAERGGEEGYSRAPTVTLSGSLDALNRPAKRHMQLFVLEYHEGREKDVLIQPFIPPPPPQQHPGLWGRGSASSDRPARARSSRWVAADAAEGPEEEAEDGDEDEEAAVLEEGDAPADEDPDAFAEAMRLPLRVAQAFSVLPVDVVTGRWVVRRAAYALLVSGGLSLLTALSAVREVRRPNSKLVDFMVVVFYLMSAVTAWLFIRLSRHWAGLLRAFRFQERRHGACAGLRRTITALSMPLLAVAFVEHSLSEIQIVVNLRIANQNVSSFHECLEVYVSANYPMVILAIGYWPIISPVLFFLNFTATFLWNFNDLFIMLVAVALASRFRFLHESVTKLVGDTVELEAAGLRQRPLGTAYWRSVRNAYNSLCRLARRVDRALSSHLLVSFVNNLYFICMQLLRGFNDPLHSSWYSTVYIVFSFGFLVVRTSAVSLLAASVRDNSRSIKDALYGVCSEDYDDEVYRFLVQVTSEEVALTGLNMFNVTRGLLLTVAGTIFTYEVVLFQIGRSG